MNSDAADIIEAIHVAFLEVSRGAITLHEAEVIDEYGSDAERDEARQLDKEAQWTEIPDEHVEKCTTALCHLDPVSWRYYVPRYMEWSLRHFQVSDPIVSDFTIYTFGLGSNSDLSEYAMERFRQLTREQSKVVARFLRYMMRHPELADADAAEQALEEYWSAFEEAAG